jgi:hypothetical protein
LVYKQRLNDTVASRNQKVWEFSYFKLGFRELAFGVLEIALGRLLSMNLQKVSSDTINIVSKINRLPGCDAVL